ncbi:MAG: hypothetical protein IJH82_09225 [Lachnospiraceae bacterium]|nr:hypothetical protein [Lachnospiraceae bacterium]
MSKGKADTRRIVLSSLTGILLGLFLVFGFCTQSLNRLPVSDVRMWLLLIVISAAFSALVFLFLGWKGIRNSAKIVSPKARRNFVLCASAFMLVFWLIQLLGIYPGFFNYDADEQWIMYANSAVTAHHPVIHTYLVGKCLHLSYLVFKSPLPGCFLYVCFQMLLCAGAFGAVLSFLLKKRLGIIWGIVATIYFTFAPTVVICVMSVTKDSMFTPFLILFVLETIRFLTLKEGEKQGGFHVAVWFVSAFLASVLRNNALYVMVPFMIFLIIAFRKSKTVFGLLGVIAALILYLGPVTSLITVEGVNEREYLSVPVQQLMRVYHLHKDELKEDEIRQFEEAFETDALVAYIPKIADVAKGSLKRDYFDANRKEMVKLWMNLGSRYPAEYAEAFLMGNAGFWYPWTRLALTANGAEGYYVCRSYLPVWNASKIPAIMEYYKHYENANVVCNNPFTMWIFAPATYFIAFLLTFVWLVYKRSRESLALLAVLLIWLTFLLGPVALVRYVGFLYGMIPLEIALLAKPKEEENE